MEQSAHSTITARRPPSPPSRDDTDALPNDDVLPHRVGHRARSSNKTAAAPRAEHESNTGSGGHNRDKNCKRLRPKEEDRNRSMNGVTNMSSVLIGRTVTPFLKEHIPSLYAPIGKPNNEETAKAKDPNTKYCYRHQPDSKCRRAADEEKMIMIQSELDKLSSAVSLSVPHTPLRRHANCW